MYIHMYIGPACTRDSKVRQRSEASFGHTPSPPTKSFPTKSPRVELSRRLPVKSYRHEKSHPLELRVCLSQTL